MSEKKISVESEQTDGDKNSISRRTLLVGSMGATVGSLLTAEAVAQSGDAHAAHTGGAEAAQSGGVQMARHRTYPGSLSNRI